jgi:hypothetical protein
MNLVGWLHLGPDDGWVKAFVADLAKSVPADDGTQGVTQSAPGTNPPYPNDAGLRGTSLEQLVTAALLAPFTAPAKPPAPRQAGQNLPVTQ